MFSFFRDVIRDITRRKQVKEALRESEERYRTIFNTTGTATVIIEEDQTISLANSEFEKLTGFSKLATEGKKKWTEFIPQEYLEIMKDNHRLRRTDGDAAPRNYEVQLVNSQGETRDINLTVNMIPGTKQSVASFSDITKRKWVERALRDQSLFLQRLIDNIPNPIFYKDTAGLYQGCNKAYEVFIGKPKEEIIGKSVFDVYPKDLADKYYEMDSALFRNPGIQIYDYSFSSADGTRHDVIFNKATYSNTDGTLAGLVCAVVDISERKKAEEEIRQSEALLRSIVESPPNVITFSLDINYRYIFFNKAHQDTMKNIWGAGIKLGKSMLDYIAYPEDREKAAANFDRALSGENFSVIEEYGDEKLNRSCWENLYSPIVIETGQIIGVTVYCNDISERTLAERKLRAANQKLLDIIDFLPDATLVVDKDRKVIAWNKAIEEMTGVKKEEMLGRGDYAYAVPFYGEPRPILIDLVLMPQKEIEDKYAYIIRSGGTLITETDVPFTYKGKGAILWGIATLLLDSDGNVIGAIESIRDVTERKKAEEALAAERHRFATLTERSPFGMVLFDEQGTYKYINPKFKEIFGYDLDDIPDRKSWFVKAYPDPEYRRRVLDFWGKDVRNSVPGEKKTRLSKVTCKDGEEKIISFTPVRLHTGEFLITCENITRRRLAERKLKAVNQQLMDIIDFLPDATLVIDNSGRVIAWNKAIEEMTGVKKEEMLGRGDYAYAVPFYGEPRPILIDLVLMPQKEIEDKYAYIIRSGGTLITETDVPFTYKGKGAVLWGIATLLLDSDGNVIGAIESIRDVTDHKNTVEALRLSEQRFSKIFNTSPSLMCISTVEEGRFVEVNDRFLLVTGYSREEVIGRTSSDICFWVKPHRDEVINSLREKGMINNLECIFREKSGEVYVGLYSAEIICFNDDQFILSVVNDISERKRLEEEMSRLERLNLIGEMAAGIGHEIRNPMTTVRGFLQMLGEKQECSNFKEYYNLMIEELDRANSIITEYLSLAKNKAVSKQYQNLNFILKALFPLIQADAMRTDMYVHMEMEDIPDLLLDEKEIRQLILNLVRNALEAMAPGGRIIIKTHRDGQNVVLAVQDQGKGIRPDDLEKLGTPFYTTKDSGTGLGLAVCYSIAARHNAAIRVETGPAGTTFYVGFTINLPGC